MHVYVDCVAIIIFDCHRIITVIPGSSALRHHNSSFVSMPSPVYGIINAPDFDLKPAGDSSEAIQFIDLTDSSPMFLKITYSSFRFSLSFPSTSA